MTQIVITLKKGDSLVRSLVDYCSQNNITSAWICGIGAISAATLGLYNLEDKSYIKKTLKGPFEIATLCGNIGLLNNEVVSHLHIVLSDSKMNAFGGHLEEAVTAATCEIFITILPKQIKRQFSQEIGLNLIKDYE